MNKNIKLLRNTLESKSACSDQMQHFDDNPHHLSVLYRDNIKWCIEYKTPTLEELQRTIKDVSSQYNVFIDDANISAVNPPIAVINGYSTGDITINDPTNGAYYIYVRDKGYIDIHADNNTLTFVYLVGSKSRAKITAKNRAKVVVYRTDDRLQNRTKEYVTNETKHL